MSLHLGSSASLACVRSPQRIHPHRYLLRTSPSLVVSRAVRGSLIGSCHRPSHDTATAVPISKQGDSGSSSAVVYIARSGNDSGYPDNPIPACPVPLNSKDGCEGFSSKAIVRSMYALSILAVSVCISMDGDHYMRQYIEIAPARGCVRSVLHRSLGQQTQSNAVRSTNLLSISTLRTCLQAPFLIPRAALAQGVRPSPPQPTEPIAYEVAARSSLADQLPQHLYLDGHRYVYDPQTEDAAVTASRRWAAASRLWAVCLYSVTHTLQPVSCSTLVPGAPGSTTGAWLSCAHHVCLLNPTHMQPNRLCLHGSGTCCMRRDCDHTNHKHACSSRLSDTAAHEPTHPMHIHPSRSPELGVPCCTSPLWHVCMQ